MRNLSKKAEMGMGTLIIFIAMILVAAIAAAVLISTTSSLQNQALATGSATEQEVGTSLNIVEIYGEDGETDNSLEGFGTVTRLAAGSEAIRFEDTLLTVTLNNASQDYDYNESLDCDDLSNMNATEGYGVEYNIEGPNSREGYLTGGDVATVCFGAPRAVEEGEDIRVSLIPRVGTPRTVDTNLPNLVLNLREQVFP